MKGRATSLENSFAPMLDDILHPFTLHQKSGVVLPMMLSIVGINVDTIKKVEKRELVEEKNHVKFLNKTVFDPNEAFSASQFNHMVQFFETSNNDATEGWYIKISKDKFIEKILPKLKDKIQQLKNEFPIKYDFYVSRSKPLLEYSAKLDFFKHLENFHKKMEPFSKHSKLSEVYKNLNAIYQSLKLVEEKTSEYLFPVYQSCSANDYIENITLYGTEDQELDEHLHALKKANKQYVAFNRYDEAMNTKNLMKELSAYILKRGFREKDIEKVLVETLCKMAKVLQKPFFCYFYRDTNNPNNIIFSFDGKTSKGDDFHLDEAKKLKIFFLAHKDYTVSFYANRFVDKATQKDDEAKKTDRYTIAFDGETFIQNLYADFKKEIDKADPYSYKIVENLCEIIKLFKMIINRMLLRNKEEVKNFEIIEVLKKACDELDSEKMTFPDDSYFITVANPVFEELNILYQSDKASYKENDEFLILLKELMIELFDKEITSFYELLQESIKKFEIYRELINNQIPTLSISPQPNKKLNNRLFQSSDCDTQTISDKKHFSGAKIFK